MHTSVKEQAKHMVTKTQPSLQNSIRYTHAQTKVKTRIAPHMPNRYTQNYTKNT